VYVMGGIAISERAATFVKPVQQLPDHPCLAQGCNAQGMLHLAGSLSFCGGHWHRYLVVRLAEHLFLWSSFLYRSQKRKRGPDEVMLSLWRDWVCEASERDVALLLLAYSGMLTTDNEVALVDEIDRRCIEEQVSEVLW
jgi:hypothetical protein